MTTTVGASAASAAKVRIRVSKVASRTASGDSSPSAVRAASRAPIRFAR